MVIDDDNVSFGGDAPRLEDEALVPELALHSLAEIRLGDYFVPDFRLRCDREIAERPCGRSCRPCRDRVEIGLRSVLEERRSGHPCVLEPVEAEVVAPTLEKREADLLIGERPCTKV